MPWHVAKTEECPTSRPWAVIKDEDGSVEGCHASKADAESQLTALNISESNRSESMNIERRDMAFDEEEGLAIEERAGGAPVIKGYAIVYNRLSVDMGGFRERIMPGAFDSVLGRQRGRMDLVSYFNHDANIMLGRESSGTLKVWSDEKGVGFEVTPPQSRQDILELVARRDVKGASFTFSIDKGGEAFVTDESGRAIREVRAATLYELGPVVQPAYPSTTAAVAMRSFERWLEEQKDEPAVPAEAAGLRNLAPMLRAARLRSM